MSTQATANCFLGLLCIGWPLLWAVIAWNVSRHGWLFWLHGFRNWLTRAKAGLPAERSTYDG